MAIIKINSAKISAHIGINYVCNKEKTLGKLISGKDCMPESCYDEFEMVREQNNQQGGRTYYHMIQSFAPEDKITPEQCHAIGLQMAEHCFDGYQVLVATHVDKEHMHNHFIVNSVNFKTGKKMNMHPNDLVDIKNYSNELCQQYGFVTTETKTRRNQNPKWKKNIQYLALKIMKQSYDMDGFIFNMRMHGITVKYDKDYKYMTYTDIDGHRCRDSKLFDERLLKKNLEMYFDLGGSDSLIAQDIENYKTPSSGNCTDGLTESIFELLANLQVPSNQNSSSGYDEDDEELDKIVRKMRAHGLKVTKAQLAYCRNSNANYEQEQGIGLFY